MTQHEGRTESELNKTVICELKSSLGNTPAKLSHLVHEVWNHFEETSFNVRQTEIEMSECIYENEPDEGVKCEMRKIRLDAAVERDEGAERMAVYEVEDYHRGHHTSLNTERAVEQNTLDQQPGEKIIHTHAV